MLNNYPIESYTPERIQEAILILHPKVLGRYEISKWKFYAAFPHGSNFSHLKYPLKDEYGNVFQDSEWYYMALRFDNLEIKRRIAEESKVKGGSKREAYKYKEFMDIDDNNRIEFMRESIQKKYDNSEWRREMLIKTWEKEIIELTYWKDMFFGICHKTRQWRNVLGKLHMEYRDNL